MNQYQFGKGTRARKELHSTIAIHTALNLVGMGASQGPSRAILSRTRVVLQVSGVSAGMMERAALLLRCTVELRGFQIGRI